MWASDSWSCPEEASASKPAQEGFGFLWAILSCLSGPGGRSCLVLYCPVCLAPEGSDTPSLPQGNFLGGSKSSGCRGQAEGTEAKAPKTICHGLQSSQLRHGLQSSQLLHGLLSSLHRHGFQSSQLQNGPCLSVPLWRSPSCVLVRICPEGPPERPPARPPLWNC